MVIRPGGSRSSSGPPEPVPPPEEVSDQGAEQDAGAAEAGGDATEPPGEGAGGRSAAARTVRWVRSGPDAVARRVGGAVDVLYRWLETNRVTRFPWAVIQTFSQAHGALLSGSIAYYTFLSILPLLLLAGFVLGTVTVGSTDLQDLLSEAISGLLPGMQGEQLLEQLIHARETFGIVGLVAVAYAGSGFVGALTASLNRMWGVETGRNPIGQKLLNLGFVTLLGVVLVGSVGLTVWVRYVTVELLDRRAAPVLSLLEWLASPVAIFLVLLLLYRLLPARRLGWLAQLPGAVFAAVAVELLKRGFQIWASHSAGVAALPRTLLSVVLLLVWFGFFGQAVLYGAALNVTLRRRDQKDDPTAAPEGP